MIIVSHPLTGNKDDDWKSSATMSCHECSKMLLIFLSEEINMTDELSKAEITKFTALFSQYDKDGDNTITSKELVKILDQLEISYTAEEVADLMYQVASDNIGVIDLEEFLMIMQMKLNKLNP